MQIKKNLYDSSVKCSDCGKEYYGSEFPKLAIDDDFKIKEAFCNECYKKRMDHKMKKAKNFSAKHSFSRSKNYKNDMLKLCSNSKAKKKNTTLITCSQCEEVVAMITNGQVHNINKFEYYGDDELVYCSECLKDKKKEV